MTFEELEHSLPNGLHDAEFLAIEVDLERAETTLRISIDLQKARRRADVHKAAWLDEAIAQMTASCKRR